MEGAVKALSVLKALILLREYFFNFPKLYILRKITKNNFGYQKY